MNQNNEPVSVALANPTESIIKEDNKESSLNLFGMQIKISDIIGDKLVDQFMATISPEQMDAINKILFNEIFENKIEREYDSKSNKYINVQTTVFKTKSKRPSEYSWSSHEQETPIYVKTKNTIIQKYNELIEQKVQEYLNSDEYKEKATAIAKEIIDYALEGYKKDIMQNLKDKLVISPFDCTEKNELTATIETIAHEVFRNEMRAIENSKNYCY